MMEGSMMRETSPMREISGRHVKSPTRQMRESSPARGKSFMRRSPPIRQMSPMGDMGSMRQMSPARRLARSMAMDDDCMMEECHDGCCHGNMCSDACCDDMMRNDAALLMEGRQWLLGGAKAKTTTTLVAREVSACYFCLPETADNNKTGTTRKADGIIVPVKKYSNTTIDDEREEAAKQRLQKKLSALELKHFASHFPDGYIFLYPQKGKKVSCRVKLPDNKSYFPLPCTKTHPTEEHFGDSILEYGGYTTSSNKGRFVPGAFVPVHAYEFIDCARDKAENDNGPFRFKYPNGTRIAIGSKLPSPCTITYKTEDAWAKAVRSGSYTGDHGGQKDIKRCEYLEFVSKHPKAGTNPIIKLPSHFHAPLVAIHKTEEDFYDDLNTNEFYTTVEGKLQWVGPCDAKDCQEENNDAQNKKSVESRYFKVQKADKKAPRSKSGSKQNLSWVQNGGESLRR